MDEAMSAQVLIDPQGVEGFRVESGGNMSTDDPESFALVGEGLGEAFVVAFKSGGVGAEVGPKALVVVGGASSRNAVVLEAEFRNLISERPVPQALGA